MKFFKKTHLLIGGLLLVFGVVSAKEILSEEVEVPADCITYCDPSALTACVIDYGAGTYVHCNYKKAKKPPVE